MNIPVNGRIAIVDDQIDQVYPLINILSKNQCPFSYFSGEEKYLPTEGNNYNDIRVLFLDINLIDNANHENKVLKAKLVPVIKRIVSEKNFPYVLIFWSRHEAEHKVLIEDIFENDLSDRKPIAFMSQNKLSYFNLDGTKTNECDELTEQLFQSISATINDKHSYSYILNWENQAHYSTDKTLEEVFSYSHSMDEWENTSNYIFTKLGISYAGKHYKDLSPTDKIINSYQAFNNIFLDSLEYTINNGVILNPIELTFDPSRIETEVIINNINKKLLTSDDKSPLIYPGTLIECSEKQNLFKDLLFKVVSFLKIKEKVKNANLTVNDIELKKMADTETAQVREEIKKTWKCVLAIVTPLCDYVQKDNKKFDRIIKGVLILSQYKQFIDDKTESVFISPSFMIEGHSYILVLDFRFFFTDNLVEGDSYKPIFRLRQQLLAEIQSKLARHISRQGILFLDTY